jgi:putative FmdB family regulatory protein
MERSGVPTYTYECKKCGRPRDVFHAISASPRIRCRACGGPCKRRLGTGGAIIFKGSGFYETDYRKADGKVGEKGEKVAETKSEAKTETKTETKTESKGGKSESKSSAPGKE